MLISQADLARAAAVSRKTTTDWKAKGLLVLQGSRIDLEPTLARMKANHRGGHDIVARVTKAFSGPVTGNDEDVPPVLPLNGYAIGFVSGGQVAGQEIFAAVRSELAAVGSAPAFATQLLGRVLTVVCPILNEAAEEMGYVPEPELEGRPYFNPTTFDPDEPSGAG